MKKAFFAVMLLGVLSASGNVLEQGTFELGLDGKMDFENENGKLGVESRLSLGFFIVDDIQAGGILAFACDGTSTGWGMGPYGEINFDINAAVVPFIAMRITANAGEFFHADHLLAEGAGGLKFFISESVAPAIELYYDLASKSVFNNNDRYQSYDFGIRFGIRSYF